MEDDLFLDPKSRDRLWAAAWAIIVNERTRQVFRYEQPFDSNLWYDSGTTLGGIFFADQSPTASHTGTENRQHAFALCFRFLASLR